MQLIRKKQLQRWPYSNQTVATFHSAYTLFVLEQYQHVCWCQMSHTLLCGQNYRSVPRGTSLLQTSELVSTRLSLQYVRSGSLAETWANWPTARKVAHNTALLELIVFATLQVQLGRCWRFNDERLSSYLQFQKKSCPVQHIQIVVSESEARLQEDGKMICFCLRANSNRRETS